MNPAPTPPADAATRRDEPALAWCNRAAISTHEDQDAITVNISVGDARGGFAFTVRRMPDSAFEHAGRLLLHTPYPGEPMPHVGITELRPGTYLIDS
ncbi:MAG: hypothetical protein ACRDRH_00295 [Pseudonocardia sp.]